MVKKILIAVVALIVVFVAVVATRPSTTKIERSAEIAAPAEVVFAQVNNFHRWDGWSPWAKLDPNMKQEFSGPESGVGAFNKWTGNDDVGEGQMTIVESTPNERVRIKLEFLKPFAQESMTAFTFKGAEKSTNVTWTMEMNNNFLSKAMGLFMDMDAMVGKDFEKGLGQMKAVSEAEASRVAAEMQAKAAAAEQAAAALAAQAAAEQAAAEAAAQAAPKATKVKATK